MAWRQPRGLTTSTPDISGVEPFPDDEEPIENVPLHRHRRYSADDDVDPEDLQRLIDNMNFPAGAGANALGGGGAEGDGINPPPYPGPPGPPGPPLPAGQLPDDWQRLFMQMMQQQQQLSQQIAQLATVTMRESENSNRMIRELGQASADNVTATRANRQSTHMIVAQLQQAAAERRPKIDPKMFPELKRVSEEEKNLLNYTAWEAGVRHIIQSSSDCQRATPAQLGHALLGSLTGEAARQAQTILIRDDQSLEDILTMIRETLCGTSIATRAYAMFLQRNQKKTEDLACYSSILKELFVRSHPTIDYNTSDDLKRRFLDGLLPVELSRELIMHANTDPMTFDELRLAAQKTLGLMERAHARTLPNETITFKVFGRGSGSQAQQTGNSKPSGGSSGGASGGVEPMEIGTVNKTKRGSRGGKGAKKGGGDKKGNSSSSQGSNASGSSGGSRGTNQYVEQRECYHCKKKGHLKPNCPDLKKGSPVASVSAATDQASVAAIERFEPAWPGGWQC